MSQEMGKDGKAGPATGEPPRLGAPGDEKRTFDRVIEVRPEEVLQPDRRPWSKLTLSGVVVRAVAASAIIVALFLVLVVAIFAALRLG